MLTADGCRTRRDRLWANLPDKPDWILLAEPQHLTYFAGYYASPFVYSSQNAPALLLLGQDGSSLLLADNLLQPFAKAAHIDRVESPLWYRGRESATPRQERLVQAALEVMKTCPGQKIGVEPAVPTALTDGLRQERGPLTLTDVGPTIHTLKRRKDPDEVAVLQQCMRAAEAGFAAAICEIKPGMTELQSYEIVARAAIEEAGQPVIVYGDFAAGPNTEHGGGPPGPRVIEKNDLYILDFSVVVHGYRSDLANTFVVDGGTPSGRVKELAEYCLEAMAVGEQGLKAGAVCRDLDASVRSRFISRNLGENGPSHVGHGIGLGHPDPPYIVPESSDTLLAGNVVTIEPGVYVKGVGGMRFEHNYLVTETGFERLSHHHIGLQPPQ